MMRTKRSIEVVNVSVTCLYTPFKEEFEPVVRVGENIAIPKTAEEYEYYEVTYIEPIQPITIPVSLSAYEKNKEVVPNEIKLEDNEAGQWRLWIPDFIAVKMNFPRAARKWVTKEEETYATPLSMAKENVLEFFTHKGDVPVFYVDNPVGESQTARLIIWGFKYSLKKLDVKPAEYTVLPAYSSMYVVGGAGR